MKIETLDGIEIYCLPECAICLVSAKNPMEMDDCPCGNHVCTPDGCMNYFEDWEQRKEE